jgi:hypothetical protein
MPVHISLEVLYDREGSHQKNHQVLSAQIFRLFGSLH